MNNKSIITNETAVKYKEDDLLNYYPYAEKIQKIIQGYADNPKPLTIGIYGKWGSGKSSLLNLIENQIEIFHKENNDSSYIKFHYNPWIYQSKEEMLFDFFETLSRKVTYSKDNNLKKAGIFIKKYSRYLKSIKLSASGGIPKVFNMGITVEPYEILRKLGEDLEGEDKSLDEMKEDINVSLKSSNKKIIVFIDDVDRLDKDEIFTLFKLIKINADFSNLIFIICLDKEHVTKAIYTRYGTEESSGEEFLEKIINIPLELPLIEEGDLTYFIKEKIKPILNQRIIKDIDIQELYDSLDGPYFESPREIIRIINSFSISLFAIGDEVNLHDLFWVEYLKIKYNKVYKKIKNYSYDIRSNQIFESIISMNKLSYSKEGEGDVESGMRKEIKEEYPKIIGIIESLFPVKKTGMIVSAFQNKPLKSEEVIDRELRINHVNHFEKYFSFHTKNKVSELKIIQFKEFISLEESDKAEAILKEMLLNAIEHKVVYRISSELHLMPEDRHDKYILFLIQNLDVFKDVNIDAFSSRITIIKEIADKLRKGDHQKNKALCFEIANYLDYSNLSHFLKDFLHDNTSSYITELEKINIEKIKDSDWKKPFYFDRYMSIAIMRSWSLINFEEMNEFLLSSFNSRENIIYFIRSFPNVWNTSINGIFKPEDYNLLKYDFKINADIIFQKIKDFFPEISLDELKLESKTWAETINNSSENNLKQFVYWHIEDFEKQKRKLLI